MLPGKTSNEYLPCRLTSSELDKTSADLAAAVKQVELIESDKKDTMALFAERLKLLRAEVSTLAEKVDSKTENRTVECEWIPNEMTKKWAIRRTDTMDTIREEKMSDKDLQMDLPEGPA